MTRPTSTYTRFESLGAIGIDLRQHDIKFEEDNWEAPTLSAWGVGWQVMLDGLEITQFTYFQQCGGVDLFPICAELTYGLERIGAFLQDVDSIYDIVWARDPDTGAEVKYGDVRLADELQFSVYNFEDADVDKAWKHFDLYEAECKGLIDKYVALTKSEKAEGDGAKSSAQDKHRFPLLGAYDLCLKCSHLFNILDARGAISVTERVGVIARVRALAVGIAKAWVDQQKAEAAQKAGRFRAEIAPVEITTKKGTIVFDTDEYIRPGTTAQALGELKPAFSKEGTVTAGNASGLNDGAAAVVMMSARVIDLSSRRP